MAVYVVAQLRFTGVARYRRYQERFPAVFANSGGRVLAADEAPDVLEGDWPLDKLVIMEFPDDAMARAFLDSPAYQEVSEDRRAGAAMSAVLVRGLG